MKALMRITPTPGIVSLHATGGFVGLANRLANRLFTLGLHT